MVTGMNSWGESECGTSVSMENLFCSELHPATEDLAQDCGQNQYGDVPHVELSEETSDYNERYREVDVKEPLGGVPLLPIPEVAEGEIDEYRKKRTNNDE